MFKSKITNNPPHVFQNMSDHMIEKIKLSFNALRKYCEYEQFKGYDPFDGLNSSLFQAFPLLPESKLIRLLWIQLFKKNPVNIRGLVGIKKEYNPKGIALFLNGYCRLYKIEPNDQFLNLIKHLAKELIDLRTKGFSGSCWGYNFEWQNRAFLQRRYAPTVVASTFAGCALLDAYEITGDNQLKQHALSIGDFILNDLNRTYNNDTDFAFSYSPIDKTQVVNATLLASRMLSRIYKYTGNKEIFEAARSSVNFSCKLQNPDGSWLYGSLGAQRWIDNFHTGYNLECLAEYERFTGDQSFNEYVYKGLSYYLSNFFLPSGIPKYYNNSIYPVDIHSASQLIFTLSKTNKFNENQSLVNSVLNWTIDKMQDPEGYFYYQKHRWYTNKIPYMRWSQAWMFFALSEYLYCTKSQR